MSSEQLNPALVPILVRTFGRTGSTLLMQILGTSDRICFERSYPFEQRYLTYVYNHSRLVTLPGTPTDEWNNDVLFRSESPLVGCLPYTEIKSFDRDALAKSLFVSTWAQFSQAMREARGLEDDMRCFYAEKAPRQAADQANEQLGGKNLYLLRDPRDEMVSIRNFNQKRGFNSFGWLDTDDDLGFARKLCCNRRRFLQNASTLQTDERRILIRYEDLINRQQLEVDRLCEWLNVSLSYADATDNRSIKQQHMTSASPAASVERWRTELDEEIVALFRKELGDELAELGYSV